MAVEGAQRRGWLESLRGIAALQVLVLHLLGAFCLPAITGETEAPLARWLSHSPLALLYDGESAVYLFFVLSGVVLAGAFERQLGAPAAALASRLLRLGIPAIASCLLAFLAFHAFPSAHAEAGARLGASWLNSAWTGDGSLASLLWEAGPAALLMGFHAAAGPLPSLASAYNAPLWTLAIELHGSVLVFLLLLLRRRFPRAWRVMAVLAVLLLWRTPYDEFLLGALGALAAPRLAAWRHHGPALASIAGIGALALCWLALDGAVGPLAALRPEESGPLALSGVELQRSLGALLAFTALAAAPALQQKLESPLLAWLGRYSFPLYLVHWPIILGPGAALYLLAEPALGDAAARLLAIITAAALSFGVARLFRPLDEAATRWSRALRSALAARDGSAPATVPALAHVAAAGR